ncbi:hypothetical protein [Nocardia sp. NPDC004260]
MPEIVGSVKAAVLIRVQNNEPIEVGTLELPLRAEKVAEGQVQCTIDTSVFERFGKALADAVDEEAN